MRYGLSGALFFATGAEDHAIVGVLYHCFLFSVFFLEFVDAEFAVVYAFSAAEAFFVVYCWVPGYLVSGDAVECFFGYFSFRSLCLLAFSVS